MKLSNVKQGLRIAGWHLLWVCFEKPGSWISDRANLCYERWLMAKVSLMKATTRRVRWIETRGCMAEQDYKVEEGIVSRLYYDRLYPERELVLMIEVKLDAGPKICMPLRAFNFNKEDGVLEYRY